MIRLFAGPSILKIQNLKFICRKPFQFTIYDLLLTIDGEAELTAEGQYLFFERLKVNCEFFKLFARIFELETFLLDYLFRRL